MKSKTSDSKERVNAFCLLEWFAAFGQFDQWQDLATIDQFIDELEFNFLNGKLKTGRSYWIHLNEELRATMLAEFWETRAVKSAEWVQSLVNESD